MTYEYKFNNKHFGLIFCLASAILWAYLLVRFLDHEGALYAAGYASLITMPFFAIGITIERFRNAYLRPIKVTEAGVWGNVTDGKYNVFRPRLNYTLIPSADVACVTEVTEKHDPRFSRLDENGGIEIRSSCGIIYIYKYISGYKELRDALFKAYK